MTVPAAEVQPILAVYQPLFVGLGAVVLGLIANTILEWVRLHLANAHAARALRRALAEETEDIR
jgi:hypothetical protein